MPAAVVILAAGSGTRVGAGSTRCCCRSATPRSWPGRCATRSALDDVRRVVLVVPRRRAGRRRPRPSRRTSATTRCCVVDGGDTRHALGVAGAAGAGAARSRPARSTWSRSTTAPGRWPAAPVRAPRSPPRASTAARSRSCPLARPARAAACDPRRGPTWSACRPRRRSAPAPLLAAYRAADADGFEGTDTAAASSATRDAARSRRCPSTPAQPQDHLPRGRRPRRAAAGSRGPTTVARPSRGERLQQPEVVLGRDPAGLGRRLDELDRVALAERGDERGEVGGRERRRAAATTGGRQHDRRGDRHQASRSTVAPTDAVARPP